MISHRYVRKSRLIEYVPFQMVDHLKYHKISWHEWDQRAGEPQIYQSLSGRGEVED